MTVEKKYKRRFDLVAPRPDDPTAKPRQMGDKARWLRLGSAFEREDGRIDCRIEMVPLLAWDGRFYLFEARAPEGTTTPSTYVAPEDRYRYTPPAARVDADTAAEPTAEPTEAAPETGFEYGARQLREIEAEDAARGSGPRAPPWANQPPKIHLNGASQGKTFCDLFAKEKNKVDDWAAVTCKRCLRLKPP